MRVPWKTALIVALVLVCTPALGRGPRLTRTKYLDQNGTIIGTSTTQNNTGHTQYYYRNGAKAGTTTQSGGGFGGQNFSRSIAESRATMPNKAPKAAPVVVEGPAPTSADFGYSPYAKKLMKDLEKSQALKQKR